MYPGTCLSVALFHWGGEAELGECMGRAWSACILPLGLYMSPYTWMCTCVCGSVCVHRSGGAFLCVCIFVPASMCISL